MLAPGFDRAECRAQSFPHRIGRRFARALTLIDRAEAASAPRKARSKLRHVARLLGKTAEGVERTPAHHPVTGECVSALSAMLADGQRRATELASAL